MNIQECIFSLFFTTLQRANSATEISENRGFEIFNLYFKTKNLDLNKNKALNINFK